MSNPERRPPPDVAGYEIHRLIGLGGMGEVHLARQVALNRRVAIKFLTRTAGDPPEEYEARFRREAELMAQISHPNVVTIFDFGAVAGRPYLVMEYVEGGDLRSRMVPDLPMNVGEIRAIMKPVLEAVEHLHSRGIVHRDMKPENILMLRERTPKVTDFGIAVLDFAMGSLTRTGRSLGTPGYVAPEQQYGLKVDARADQFSLAALCYEMATGRKPLGAFPPPEKLNPKLGPGAGRVILKGLSDDPTDRYGTIEEFGEALDRGLAAADGTGSRRARVALLATIAGLSILMGVAAFLVADAGPPRPTPPARTGPSIDRIAQIPPGSPEPPATVRASRVTAPTVGMTLVLVPSGEFWMGSPAEDGAALPQEFPRHLVRISRPFYLGEKEVTVGQFRRFVEATGYRTSAETPAKDGSRGGWRYNMKAGKLEQLPELNWRNPGGTKPQSDDEPVVQVSWVDANAFCDWLSAAWSRRVRLPTEAEWEYACRAESTSRWCCGDDPAALDPFAWTIKNAGNVFHPTGTRKPNAFGLFDMHGNAWEWCADEYSAYTGTSVVDPQSPPREGGTRMLRGGSFDWDKVERTRSASRHNYPALSSYYNYGFRVCSPAP